jgi:hypothetical protein
LGRNVGHQTRHFVLSLSIQFGDESAPLSRQRKEMRRRYRGWAYKAWVFNIPEGFKIGKHFSSGIRP